MRNQNPMTRLALLAALVSSTGSLGALAQSGVPTAEPTSKPIVRLTASITGGLDSNVFLQDHAPNPAIPAAIPAHRSSWFSTVAASTSLDYKLSGALTATLTYQPEATFYSDASSENHSIQRASLVASGQIGTTTWSFQNGMVLIDGSDTGPTYGGPGGAAGMGGVPLRERRDAFVNRSALKLKQNLGGWWVRPGVTTYYHDWRTRQSRNPGYQNYVDREEWSAGCDLGRAILPKADLFIGVRRGRQDQRKLYAVDSPYDSHVTRWVAGVEGTLRPGLQCSLTIGPEKHEWVNASGLPAIFDQGKTLWWIDAAVTYSASARSTFLFSHKRFALPTFGGVGYFEDITYDLSWRYRATDRLSGGISCRSYSGRFLLPVVRSDHIYTPSLQLQYRLDQHSTLEFSDLYDSATSELPNASGRDYHRHVATMAYRRAF